MKLDDRGRKITDPNAEMEFGENVPIVDPIASAAAINRAPVAASEAE